MPKSKRLRFNLHDKILKNVAVTGYPLDKEQIIEALKKRNIDALPLIENVNFNWDEKTAFHCKHA